MYVCVRARGVVSASAYLCVPTTCSVVPSHDSDCAVLAHGTIRQLLHIGGASVFTYCCRAAKRDY